MKTKLILVAFFSIILFESNTAFSQTGWVLKNSNTTTNLNSIHFANEFTGIVVANNGVILKTIDGGDNWFIVNTINKNLELKDVVMINNETVFICGGDGKIFKSTNGGIDFELNVQSPNSNTIKKMMFLDNQTGYAVSDKYFHKTNDGGQNWFHSLDTIQYTNLSSFHFIDSQTGWRIFQGTRFFPPQLFNEKFVQKTTNGGISWTSIYSAYSQPVFGEIFFIDPMKGFIVIQNSFNEYLYRSTDGGISWDNAYTNLSGENRSIYFINSTFGWAVGSFGVVRYSSNSGNNWTGQVSNTNSHLNKIFFINENTGWIVGNNGVIFKTTTGGLITSITNSSSELPTEYSLHQNYPNPFNPETSISFDIPVKTNVELKVYNSIGKEVTVLIQTSLDAGTHSILLNANSLPSGVYFYKLTAGEYRQSRKLLLLK